MLKKILLLSLIALPAMAQTPNVSGQNSSNWQYLSYPLVGGTTTTSPTMVAFNGMNPPKWFSLSVTSTAGSAIQVALEGSVNNVSWRQIAVTSSALGAISNTVPLPSIYLRLRAITLSNNVTITPTAVGVW